MTMTNYMLFGPRGNKLLTDLNLRVAINGIQIKKSVLW